MSGSVRHPASFSSVIVAGGRASPRARSSRTSSASGRGASHTRPMLCTALLPEARCPRGCETHQLGRSSCVPEYTRPSMWRRPCESRPGQLAPRRGQILPAESVPLAEPRRRLVRLAAYLSGAQRRSTLDLRVSPTLSLNPSPPTPAPARRGPTNSGVKTRAATV
jgi:hypothetical protein